MLCFDFRLKNIKNFFHRHFCNLGFTKISWNFIFLQSKQPIYSQQRYADSKF